MKNNIRKNTINALSGSIYFLVLAALIFLYGCDTFEEDNIQEATKLSYKKEITILINTSAVIDFGKLVQVNGNFTTQIVKDPTAGKLTILKNELYKYTPNEDFVTGRDQIPFAVYGIEHQLLFSDTLGINVVTSWGDSCTLSAIEDYYTVDSDSITPLMILSNDQICDSMQVDISILQNPDYGSVAVENGFITYNSHDYIGTDQFVYRITDENDLTSDALVNISIGDSSCDMVLRDDYLEFDLHTSSVMIDVLANDDLCDKDVSIATSISRQPEQGAASFTSDNLINYTPYQNTFTYTDSLVYQVCDKVDCYLATLQISAYEPCNGLEAFDDMLNISDTTAVAGIYLDITSNDFFCDTVNVSILTPPQYGNASIEDNSIYYEPDPGEVTNDELIYELCNNNQECDQATVTIIREH